MSEKAEYKPKKGKKKGSKPKSKPETKPAPEPVVAKPAAANPVGRPRNVVKLTETDLDYDLKNFIAGVSSRTGLTGDDIALVSLYMAAQQCQASGVTVIAGRMKQMHEHLCG